MTAISQSVGPALLLDEMWLDLSLVKRTQSTCRYPDCIALSRDVVPVLVAT
jgi:hypothetical protein